jgi:multidrug efflux system membrane fusion protein
MATTQTSEQEQQAALSNPTPTKSGGGALRAILIVLVVGAAVGFTIWKIRANNKDQVTTSTRAADAAHRPLPVMMAPVEQKTMPIYLSALGTVTAYYSVTIKTRVDGQLMSVPVREGQAVRKGQILAEIDPRPYEAALAQAKGQLIKDQANAKNAEAEAQRYRALLDAGVVSKETQQAQESTAGQALGSIAADEAAIQAANVNLVYTKITSPIDGIVGLRQVDPGNIVHAADTTGLLLVTQLQPISVIFTLPEDQLLTLDNQIDQTTGTDKVKAVFGNKDGALFPNQFVNVRLILQQRPNALVVPASAIQTGSQGTFVYVVKEGKPPVGLARPGGGGGRRGGGGGSASSSAGSSGAAAGSSTPDGAAAAKGPSYYVLQQPVKVDLTEGTQVILASGVNPGDEVVVDGQEKLLQGSRVIPKTQAATTGGGAKANSGEGSGAFGPGTAGPSEPSSNPNKEGVETGNGVPAAAHGGHGHGAPGASPDGQPHEHHRQGNAQTGQPQ